MGVPSRDRRARVALAAIPLLAAACASTRTPVAAGPTAEEERAARVAEAARRDATELFYRGKALALAGDRACARLDLEASLAAFAAAARPGDPEDLSFGRQLWESVSLYRAITDAAVEDEERPPAEPSRDSLVAEAPAPSPDEVERARHEVAAATPATAGYDIPIVVNDAVLRAVAYYQFRTPQAFAGAIQRSGRYAPLMRRILREEGLPEDLLYVAFIESAFKSGAHSRRAAHGYWQFIDGTGKRYGLRRGRGWDERSDPVKSTRAAARYLRDLYEMFGDWHLAMAAYDTGEGRVLRALQRSGARDYWELREGPWLHPEARNYVPFVMAAALIGKDPSRYGFDVVTDPPLDFEVVTLTKPLELSRVASAAGVTVEELRALNGELKANATPRGFRSYDLRVPRGTGEKLAARLGGLPAAPEVTERVVRARKGDTIERLAKRHRVPVAALAEWNDLPLRARLTAGSEVLIPTKGARKPVASAANASPEDARPAPARGEIRSLPTPAAAVTDAAAVKRSVSSPAPAAPRPQPERYEIPAAGFENTAPASDRAAARQNVHTVKRGETLYSISRLYDVSVETLRRWNRLGGRRTLVVGTRLRVSGD